MKGSLYFSKKKTHGHPPMTKKNTFCLLSMIPVEVWILSLSLFLSPPPPCSFPIFLLFSFSCVGFQKRHKISWHGFWSSSLPPSNWFAKDQSVAFPRSGAEFLFCMKKYYFLCSLLFLNWILLPSLTFSEMKRINAKQEVVIMRNIIEKDINACE